MRSVWILTVAVIIIAACESGTTATSSTATTPTPPTEATTTSMAPTTTSTTTSSNANDSRVQAVIEVGTLPRGVAFFDGNVWVANARDASVSRVDPSSEAEAAEVATGETPITLMVLGDSLWVSVIGEEQGVVEENALENIDPETNTVAASWPVPIFHNTAAGAGLLWAFDSQNSLQAIEPETGQIAGTIEVGGSVQTIAATDETVWGAQTSGRIWKVDIGEMAVVAEFDTNDLVPGRSRIAATPGGAALAYKETLVVVDDDTESFEVVPMPSLRNVNDLVMVEEALWLSGTVVSDSGTMGVLLAIDPTTGEVIDTYELGPEPAGVSVGAGSIWVGDQVENVLYRLGR